jgi:hypothetical protein
MWKSDAPYKVDPIELIAEGSNNYSLIAKYADIRVIEKRKLHKLSITVEAFRFKLTRFYRDGALTQQELDVAKSNGWEIPPEGKAQKPDIKGWVESNPTMIQMYLELSEQNDIIEFLELVLKSLHSRGYNITTSSQLVIKNNGG